MNEGHGLEDVLEWLLAGRVEHFVFDFCRVGTPGQHYQLFLDRLTRALTRMLVLVVKQTVAAVGGTARHYVLQEVRVGRILGTCAHPKTSLKFIPSCAPTGTIPVFSFRHFFDTIGCTQFPKN